MTQPNTQYAPQTVQPKNGGTQCLFKFPNGYGASVIQGPYSYGGKSGLWELAVLDSEGDLTYDTPVTDDVEGRLTDEQVGELLAQIAALEPIK